jgi:NADH dehydrogenase [ubiquinone] 1 alpha subcomplex assembly factor 1
MTFYSLFEFANPAEISLFNPIDDRVMGGVSSSGLAATDDNTATFRGVVSLENNGGFASIRAPLECPDLSNGKGIALRALGDGKRYKLRLMNSSSFNSLVYESSFVTSPGHWKEFELPFSSFIAAWRGKPVENAPEFDKNQICALGLMISEKQSGEFSLCLDWIRVYD